MCEKFSVEDIRKDLVFKKFLIKKAGLTESSINGYLYILKDFSNFTGKSPKEIHDIHKKDLIERVPEFDMWLGEALDNYVSYLISKNAQTGGIKDKVSKVKSFLNAFKLRPLPKTTVSKKQIKEDAKYALKVEDIRKAIRHSLPNYQVVFITQAQTGLSISDALLLDVEDFVFAVSKKGEKLSVKEAIFRAKNEDNLIGCFDLRRKKTSNEFYTFAGPEVLRNMATLLESRDEEYLKPDSPIFMKELAFLPISKRERLSKDVRLTRGAVIDYLFRMHKTRKLFDQIEVDGKPKNYFRSHKLRKWFSNQLRFKAGFSAEDTKYLMGQKTGDVLEHYIDTNNYHALKANYRKALPYLAINDKIVMEENQEAIEKLNHELAVNRKESKIKDKKISAMEKRIEDLEKENRKRNETLDIILKNPIVLKEFEKNL